MGNIVQVWTSPGLCLAFATSRFREAQRRHEPATIYEREELADTLFALEDRLPLLRNRWPLSYTSRLSSVTIVLFFGAFYPRLSLNHY